MATTADRSGSPSKHAVGVSDAQLRHWLSNLNRPDQLVGAEMEELLKAHGRMPQTPSPLAVGQAGAELIRDVIQLLKPGEGASREDRILHDVLRTSFMEGAKVFQAAIKLGLSERHLSRERSRALSLVKAELEAPFVGANASTQSGESIPTIRGFLERPGASRRLSKAFTGSNLIHVHGPAGIGKTSLVAEFVVDRKDPGNLFWFRFRPGVNVTLAAILFELGEYLRSIGRVVLATFMTESLPTVDLALATRLALKGLGNDSHLFVLDDYHLVETDLAIASFIEEMVDRLPGLRVITIGRHRTVGHQAGTSVEVEGLARSETKALLNNLGIDCDDEMLRNTHSWTRGNPHLVTLTASWLKTASPKEVSSGIGAISEEEEVHAFLMDNITELIDSDDREIIEGASVFRDSFSDDALAFVTQRTRGDIVDVGQRLVRMYVATRSRQGERAFFHSSVRSYIYERIKPHDRAALHARAAEWYERNDRPEEARYHRKREAEAGVHKGSA